VEISNDHCATHKLKINSALHSRVKSIPPQHYACKLFSLIQSEIQWTKARALKMFPDRAFPPVCCPLECSMASWPSAASIWYALFGPNFFWHLFSLFLVDPRASRWVKWTEHFWGIQFVWSSFRINAWWCHMWGIRSIFYLFKWLKKSRSVGEKYWLWWIAMMCLSEFLFQNIYYKWNLILKMYTYIYTFILFNWNFAIIMRM